MRDGMERESKELFTSNAKVIVTPYVGTFLRWTKERPTERGWFWCRKNGNVDFAYINDIPEDSMYLTAFLAIWQNFSPLDELEGFEWFGPITPPE